MRVQGMGGNKKGKKKRIPATHDARLKSRTKKQKEKMCVFISSSLIASYHPPFPSSPLPYPYPYPRRTGGGESKCYQLSNPPRPISRHPLAAPFPPSPQNKVSLYTSRRASCRKHPLFSRRESPHKLNEQEDKENSSCFFTRPRCRRSPWRAPPSWRGSSRRGPSASPPAGGDPPSRWSTWPTSR